jgi:hypothetical protein
MSGQRENRNPQGKIKVTLYGKITEYPMHQWKRAFRAFLDYIWSQNRHEANGTLCLDNCLTFYLNQQGYHVQYPTLTVGLERPLFDRDEILVVTNDRKDIELGLARFANNQWLKMLVIEYYDIRVMIWKVNKKATEIDCTVLNRTF